MQEFLELIAIDVSSSYGVGQPYSSWSRNKNMSLAHLPYRRQRRRAR